MGKRKCISPEVAKLVHRLQSQKESYTTIGAMFGHSKRWVCYIMKNFDPESGEPANPRQMGCKRKTTPEQDQQILELFENNKNLTKNAAKIELEKTIGKIGFSTIARRLREARKSRLKGSVGTQSNAPIPEPTLPQTSSQEGIGVPLFPQFTIPYPSTLTSLFSTFASPLGLVLPVSISLSSTNTADSDGTNATTWMTSVTAKPDEACPIIVNVRPAIPEDCDGICARIYELARSLGFPRGPSITPERLRLDAFPASRRDAPVVFAHVAQEMKSSKIVAYALYHFLYSSWEGKSMLLEDIYVEPGYRQSDIGKRLFANVCKCTLEKGCDELKLNVFRDKSGGKVFQESVNVSDKKEGNEKDENEGLVHGKLGKKVLEMLARSADANEIETKEGQL